jgi:hypothetical protein
MKFDLNQVGAPLAIGASVIGIWVYLRAKSAPTQALVNNPATNIPGIQTQLPGLTQVLFEPALGGGVGGPPQAVPSIANNIAAAANPTSPNPTAPQSSIPALYTYNYGPNFAFSKLPAAQQLMTMGDSYMHGKPGGCGCGGGCSSCVSKCDQINARFPDGRGGCFSKTVNPVFVNKTATNISFYLASENIVPSAPYLGIANG